MIRFQKLVVVFGQMEPRMDRRTDGQTDLEDENSHLDTRSKPRYIGNFAT